MFRRAAAWVGTAMLVFLTSLGLVVSPVAPAMAQAAPPKEGVIVKAGRALGTKLSPLRFAKWGALTPAGLAVNTVGAVAGYWLTSTESGQEFAGNVVDWLGEQFGGPQTGGRYCVNHPNVTWDGGIPTIVRVSVSGPQCSPYQDNYGTGDWYVVCETTQAYSTIPAGTRFSGYSGVRIYDDPGTTPSDPCIGPHNQGAPVPVGVRLGITSGDFRTAPTWWPNPDYIGPAYDQLGQIEIRKECKDSAGVITTVTARSAPGSARIPTADCPEGTSPVGYDLLGYLGGMINLHRPLMEAYLQPSAVEQYPECLGPGSPGCGMDILIDGEVCAFGVTGCATWWETYLSPTGGDRVECHWGPYRMPVTDCLPLRYAYVTDHGTVADPGRPADHLPVPITDPGPPPVPWSPTTPLPGDPGTPEDGLNPSDCPPSGSPIENGLQTMARDVLRCALVEFPWLVPTSGVRPWDPQAPYSDHPSGNAVDLGVPDWDTPLGRDRGWTAAHWLVANARALDLTYVIWDGKRWPDYDGTPRWVTYTHPGGRTDDTALHRDHIHVSAVGRDAPQPGRPTDPGTETPGFPSTGTNPDPGDGTNCLSSGWSWNPVSWVYVPSKCALEWAFVPQQQTLTETATRLDTAWANTPVGEVGGALSPIADAFDQGDNGGCLGPRLVIGDPLNIDVHPFQACDGVGKLMADTCKVIIGAGVLVLGGWSCFRLITAGVGYNPGSGASA